MYFCLFSLLLGFSGCTFLLLFVWVGVFLPVNLGELIFDLCNTYMLDTLWNYSYLASLYLPEERVHGI